MSDLLQEKLENIYNRRLEMVEQIKYKVHIREQWAWFDAYMQLIREEVQLRYGKFRDLEEK